ncbi:MAG: heavy-metal-associated domain-containing protein [Holophagales bacterium]|nr:heavy-metal-associated domain-containing protein [Holophagales bacterium]
MQTKIFIDDMTCRHCEMSITNAISTITGVVQVMADLKNKMVTVTHNENTSAEIIIAKIEEIGFDAHL